MRRTVGPCFHVRGDSSAPALPVTSARGSCRQQGTSITESFSGSSQLAPSVVAWAEAIVDALRGEDRFHSASVLVPDPAAAGLLLAAHRRGPGEQAGAGPGWVVPLIGSVCGWVYRMGRPALVGDVSIHADYLAYPGSTTRSELAAPILVGGRPIGVINVESPRAGDFGIADLERLERRAAAAAESLPPDALPAASRARA
jgi:GAF domain-containing protein